MSPGLWIRQRIRSAGLGLGATYPRLAWRIGLLFPFPPGDCATADVAQHANRTAIQQRILMLPSGRPHAQVHRGSQTKQHTSFFVRTLTWLMDGFWLASVGFMAQTLERAKMHLRLATSRGHGLYAALAFASPRGSIAGARSGHGEFVSWPLRDPAARLCQRCTAMQPLSRRQRQAMIS